MRSLPRIVSQIPSDLRSFLDRVREYLGEGGDNRFVTVKELRAGGIVGTTPGGTIVPPTDYTSVDPTIPEGLTTSSGLACIFVSWTAANYLGHSRTEIWAASTNNFALKELAGTSDGNTFTHSIGDGGSRYYWIRFVNLNEVAGPYNSLTGTVGIAGTDPAYLLDVLAGSITDAELSTALNTQIDTSTTQITNVRGLYTVKMDNQGYLTGFGLMSTLADGGVPTTDFFVNADRFAVTTPTTSIPVRANSTAYVAGAFVSVASSTSKMLVCKVAGTTNTSAPNIAAVAIGTLVTDGSVTWQVASRVPLSVLTTTATVNGVSVPPGVYIDGASIVNATITNAAIGDAAITNAKIVNLSADKITAGSIQTGYIRSTTYTAGTAGWTINADGSASFNGTLTAGGATAYATGTGMFSGFDAGTYKFRVGTAAGNRLYWDGTTLTVTGAISSSSISGGTISGTDVYAGTVRTSNTTTYSSGNGFYLSGTQFRIGNPAGAYMRWTGTALELSSSAINLIDTPNLVNNAITRIEVTGYLPSPVSVFTTTTSTYTFPSFTAPANGSLFVTITSVFHNFSTGTNHKVQAMNFVNGGSGVTEFPIHYLSFANTTANFIPIGPGGLTSGSSATYTSTEELVVTAGQSISIEIDVTASVANSVVYLLDCYYNAVLFKK